VEPALVGVGRRQQHMQVVFFVSKIFFSLFIINLSFSVLRASHLFHLLRASRMLGSFLSDPA
jgi:hypothetical protein